MKRPQKPGTVPEGRIAIMDHKGNVRGHCTRAGTQSTCDRFGVHGAVLDKSGSKPVWRGRKPKC